MNTTPVSSPLRPALYTPQYIRLLITTSLFGLSWSFYLILPKYFASHFGLDPSAIGRLVAAQGIAAVAVTPVTGWLIDKFGRKPWIIVGLSGLVVSAVLFLRVQSYGPELYGAQVLWGGSMVLAFNSLGTIASDLAPRKRMAEAIGLFGAANLSMNAVSSWVGEVIAEKYAWSGVFACVIGAATMCALFSLTVDETERVQRQPLHASEHAILSWPLVRIYVAIALVASSFAALFTLHQPFALEQHVTQVRPFFLGFVITAVSVRLFGASLIDRAGLLNSSLASILLYALIPPALAFLGAEHLFFIGLCMGLAHGTMYPAVTALGIERAGASMKGSVVAYVHGAFNGGHALFVYCLGALAAHASYVAAFCTACLLTVTAAIVLRLFGRYPPPSTSLPAQSQALQEPSP